VFLDGISKPKINRLSVVWLQNHWDSLCLNITATTSYFGSQNQASYDLSVAPQNRREDEDGVTCFTWKQVGLGFSSMTRLVETRRGWCMWYHRGD
jgi:hypothetical protein